MKKEELISKLEDIEWEDFEIKEAKTSIPKSCWETVSAFSNTNGGWLVFGVKKEGKKYEILGVKNPEKIEQDFTTTLRNGSKFNKKIDVAMNKYDFDSKKVLLFYIPQKSPRDKPIYFNSPKNVFIRTGSGDQRATPEEIDHFYRQSSFEEKDKELTNFGFKELDTEAIKMYRNYFAQVNQGHRYIGLTDKKFLERIGAIKNKKVTYGGLLAFGTEDALAEGIPNYRTEYLEIDGTSYEDAPTRYNFRNSSEKGVFLTFFSIYERLTKKVEIPFSLRAGFRDDDPVHLQAIREALVNLLIHTDYFSTGNARIRVFSDRIEFFNPGALPKELKFILKEDFSQPRNPILAKIFRFAKFSENIGSGFHKMISGWKKQYKLQPVIEGGFDYYKITFPFNNNYTKTMIKTTNKTTNKRDLGAEITGLVENNPSLTIMEIGQKLQITPYKAQYYLNKLKETGRLKREGSKKKGKWVVNQTKN
jgi:ATP-dependent DNA helicase RecG